MQELSILLVEDNRDDEELALWALKRAGFSRIAVAHDGVEALAMLCGSSDQAATGLELPDLVLLDLRLPKVDGLEVLRQLRNNDRTREIHVVALSSSEDPSDQRRCHDLGVRAFMAKPLKGATLLEYLQAGPKPQMPHPAPHCQAEINAL